MYPTGFGSLANFLVLTITCTIFNGVAASNNSSQVKPVQRRQAYYYNDMYCYVCRSDRNRDCLNEVEKSSMDFSKQCSQKLVDDFNQDLKNDPPRHALPLYDNSLKSAVARQTNEMIKWGCYSVRSSDNLFALRTCYADAKVHEDNLCHSCKAVGGKISAMCCTCTKAFCNSLPAGALQLSPPALSILLCILLLIFGRLMN